jgi:hypothetical protein
MAGVHLGYANCPISNHQEKMLLVMLCHCPITSNNIRHRSVNMLLFYSATRALAGGGNYFPVFSALFYDTRISPSGLTI